jgi:hypothetical protein
MFISPQKDWNPDVARVLVPFCEMPLIPAPAATGLDVRIRNAAYDVGCKVKGATAVSVGRITAAVEQLPPASRMSARQGFAAGFQIAQDATLDDLLERALGKETMRDDRTRLFGRPCEVLVPLIGRLDRDYGALVTTGLRLSLVTAIEYHAGFVGLGRGDLAAKVEPFTRLFREGNFPMGPLRDGTFLVLVA